jgi:hypothetical protein
MRTIIILFTIAITHSVFSQKLDSSFFSTEERKTVEYGEMIAKLPLTTQCEEISKTYAKELIKLLEANAIGYCAGEITLTFKAEWNNLHDIERDFYLKAINNIKSNDWYLNNNSLPKTVDMKYADLKPASSDYENTPRSFNKLYIFYIESESNNVKKFGFISDYDIQRRFEFSDKHKIEIEKRAELEELLMEEYSNNSNR